MGLLDNVFEQKRKKEEEKQKQSVWQPPKQTTTKQQPKQQQQTGSSSKRQNQARQASQTAQTRQGTSKPAVSTQRTTSKPAASGNAHSVAGRARQTAPATSSNPRANKRADTSGVTLPNLAGYAGKQIAAGLAQAGYGAARSLDLIGKSQNVGLGMQKPLKIGPFTVKPPKMATMTEMVKPSVERVQQSADAASRKIFKGVSSTAPDTVLRGVGQAIPSALMSILTSGVSGGSEYAQAIARYAIPTAEQSILNTGSTAQNVIGTTAQAAKNMANNPMFWSSFMQTVGTDYDEAKQRGATDAQATAYSLLNSAFNAGIEVSGGIETLPGKVNQGAARGGKQLAWDIVTSAAEEGGEEPMQKLAGNALAAIIFDKNMKPFSLKDENALINPKALARDAAMGAAVGGIMGGGQLAAGQAINAGRNIQYGRQLGGDTETVRGLIDSGLEAPEGTTARRYAQVLDAKQKAGGEITAYERGRMAELNELQMQTETTPDEVIDGARVFDRSSRAYRHAQALQARIDRGGIVTDNEIRIQRALNSQQGSREQNVRDDIDRLLGTRTRIGTVVDDTGEQQSGAIQGRDITLNPFTGAALGDTARHEYGHRVSDLSGVELTSDGYEQAVQRRMSAYDMDRAKAEDETTADFARELLTNKDYVNKGQISLAKRIAERLTHISGNVTTSDGDVLTRREAQAMREQLLSAVAVAVNNRAKEGNPDTRYSLEKLDEKYMEAVNRGDMETAARMVRERAERQGYSTDDSWRMDHKSPSRKYDKPAYNLRQIYGEEIYSPMAARYYGDGAPFDQKAVDVIQAMKDAPEKVITVYRAVPTKIKDTKLRNGDWVTITEEYAREHGWRVLDDDYRIIKDQVPAKHLFTNGDSIHEFGYDNGRNEGYRNTQNNVKLLDAVTYDDDGNVIPLSKRFDASNPDIRYSRDINRAEQNKKDKAEYGISINQYAGELMRDIGVPEEQTNEYLELALRHAAGLVKNGQSEAAVSALEPTLEEMYKTARQQVDDSVEIANAPQIHADQIVKTFEDAMQSVEPEVTEPEAAEQPKYKTRKREDVPEYVSPEERANPFRKEDAEEPEGNLSNVYTNTLQKEAFGEEIQAEAEARKDEFVYDGIVQKDTYEAAQSELAERGADALIADIATDDKQWGAEDVAKTLALAMEYKRDGDIKKAVDIIALARQRATKAGQASAMWAIVNRLGPEGQFLDYVKQSGKMTEQEIERHPAKKEIEKELEGKTGEERDSILDKYGIPYMTDAEKEEASELFDTIDKLDSADDLIELIIKQSKERKTAAGKTVRKELQKQNIEFLKDTAVMQVFGKIVDRMPVSAAQKLSTYQAISHLLNFKTMLRNVLSNAGFNTTDRVATDVGALIDGIMSIFTKRRTVGVDRGIFERGRLKAQRERASRQYLDIALAVDHGDGGSKYDLSSGKRSFKGGILGRAERAMSYGLQVTDEWTKGGIEHNIRRSMERLKNSGFTDEEIDEIAKHEARYRTFQDDTMLSQILGGLKEIMNRAGIGKTHIMWIRGHAVPIHEFGFGDFAQKYTQVPGALITRDIEYSPVGYLKAIHTMIAAANNARRGAGFTPEAQRKIALSLGRAMTGTGLIAAFSALAYMGLLYIQKKGIDKKAKAFTKELGLADYGINLTALGRVISAMTSRDDNIMDAVKYQNGDVSVTLSWFEPLNSLMAMGAEISNAWDEGERNPLVYARIAGAKVFDQILDLPTMEAIRNVQAGVQRGDGVGDILIGFAADSATGFIPGPVRQLGSFLDPVQRNPYNEKNELERAKERILASIPGLRKGVSAKINPFGEEKLTTSGNKALDFFNNFINPGYTNIYQANDISEELLRLAEQSTDVLPHVPATYFTYDKVAYKPRGKDYERYSKLVGTITADMMRDVINSDEYRSMSDADKVEALSKAAADGEKEAKLQFVGGKTIAEYRQEINSPEGQARRATERALSGSIDTLAGAIASSAPDRASYYSKNSLMLDGTDFRSVKVDGVDYNLKPETSEKVTAFAQDWYMNTIKDLESGTLDLDMLCGTTARGKAHTVKDSSGGTVTLSGSYGNITDDLVKAKIYKDYIIPSSKEHAIEYYRDEITGAGTVDAPTQEAPEETPAEVPAEAIPDRSAAKKPFTTAKSRKSGGKKSGGKRSSGGVARTYSRAPAYTAPQEQTTTDDTGGYAIQGGINGIDYGIPGGGFGGVTGVATANPFSGISVARSPYSQPYRNPFSRRNRNPFERRA